jgi:hypothetical protein
MSFQMGETGGISLVDEGLLDRGHGFPQLVHELGEDILVADAPQLLLVELRALEEADAQGREELGLLPERGRRPGATQGDADVAVAERHRNPVLVGDLGGFQQLGAGQHAELATELALVGGQDEVGEQGRELPVADDLSQVEVLPARLLGERLIALGVELDAHAVGLFLDDHLANQVRGFARDVGGADQDHFASIDRQDVDVPRVVALARVRP